MAPSRDNTHALASGGRSRGSRHNSVLALQIPYSLSSPEGIICVKGLARFAHAIGEMEEFPYGCTNHHHLRLAALTQTLPKGTEEWMAPQGRNRRPVPRLPHAGAADFRSGRTASSTAPRLAMAGREPCIGRGMACRAKGEHLGHLGEEACGRRSPNAWKRRQQELLTLEAGMVLDMRAHLLLLPSISRLSRLEGGLQPAKAASERHL